MVASDDSQGTLKLNSDDETPAAPQYRRFHNKIILGSKPCRQVNGAKETEGNAPSVEEIKDTSTNSEKKLTRKENVSGNIWTKSGKSENNKKIRLRISKVKNVRVSTIIKKGKSSNKVAKHKKGKHDINEEIEHKTTEGNPSNAISKAIHSHFEEVFNGKEEFSSHVSMAMLTNNFRNDVPILKEGQSVCEVEDKHEIYNINTIKNLKVVLTRLQNKRTKILSNSTNLSFYDPKVRPEKQKYDAKDASTLKKHNESIQHLKRKQSRYDSASKKLRREEKNVDDDIKIAELYKCICGLHFTSSQLVKKHFDVCNNNNDQKEICCECNLPFDTESLVKHLYVHHSKEQYSFKFINVQSPNRFIDENHIKHSFFPNKLNEENAQDTVKIRETLGDKATGSSMYSILTLHTDKEENRPKQLSEKSCSKESIYNTKEDQLSKMNINTLECYLEIESDDEDSTCKRSLKESKKNDFNRDVCDKTESNFIGKRTCGDLLLRTLKEATEDNDNHQIKIDSIDFQGKEKQLIKEATENGEINLNTEETHVDGYISNVLYKCVECNVCFISMHDYRNHEETIKKKETKCTNEYVSCCLCKLYFTKKSDVIIHILKQHKELQLRNADEFVVISDLHDVKKQRISDPPLNVNIYSHITSVDQANFHSMTLNTTQTKNDDELRKANKSIKNVVQKDKIGRLREKEIKTKAFEWISQKKLSVDYFGNMMMQFYGNILYQCQKCLVNFLKTDAVEKHRVNCNASTAVSPCPICHLRFAGGLSYHVYIHHAVMGLGLNDLFIKITDDVFWKTDTLEKYTLENKDIDISIICQQEKQENSIKRIIEKTQTEDKEALRSNVTDCYKNFENKELPMNNKEIYNHVETYENKAPEKGCVISSKQAVDNISKCEDCVICDICNNTILRSEQKKHIELHEQRSRQSYENMLPQNGEFHKSFENFVHQRQRKASLLGNFFKASSYNKYLFQCKKCYLHYMKEADLTEHIWRCSNNLEECVQCCKKCNLKFNINTYKKHEFLHHTLMNLDIQDFVIKTHASQAFALGYNNNCSTNKSGKITNKNKTTRSNDLSNKRIINGKNKSTGRLSTSFKDNMAKNISTSKRIPDSNHLNKTIADRLNNSENSMTNISMATRFPYSACQNYILDASNKRALMLNTSMKDNTMRNTSTASNIFYPRSQNKTVETSNKDTVNLNISVKNNTAKNLSTSTSVPNSRSQSNVVDTLNQFAPSLNTGVKYSTDEDTSTSTNVSNYKHQYKTVNTSEAGADRLKTGVTGNMTGNISFTTRTPNSGGQNKIAETPINAAYTTNTRVNDNTMRYPVTSDPGCGCQNKLDCSFKHQSLCYSNNNNGANQMACGINHNCNLQNRTASFDNRSSILTALLDKNNTNNKQNSMQYNSVLNYRNTQNVNYNGNLHSKNINPALNNEIHSPWTGSQDNDIHQLKQSNCSSNNSNKFINKTYNEFDRGNIFRFHNRITPPNFISTPKNPDFDIIRGAKPCYQNGMTENLRENYIYFQSVLPHNNYRQDNSELQDQTLPLNPRSIQNNSYYEQFQNVRNFQNDSYRKQLQNVPNFQTNFDCEQFQNMRLRNNPYYEQSQNNRTIQNNSNYEQPPNVLNVQNNSDYEQHQHVPNFQCGRSQSNVPNQRHSNYLLR